MLDLSLETTQERFSDSSKPSWIGKRELIIPLVICGYIAPIRVHFFKS